MQIKARHVNQVFFEPRQKQFGEVCRSRSELTPSKPTPIPNGQGARVGES
jgi:hypothetical protein